MGRPPLLAVLAALSAVTDLIVNQGATGALAGKLEHIDLLRLVSWGELSRNLGGVAGLVALTVAITQLLQVPRRGHLLRGLALASLGGVFIPIIGVATVLPMSFVAQRWAFLSVLAIGTGNLLVVVLSITAARRAAPHGIRVAAGLFATCAFLGLTALVLGNIKPVAHTAWGYALVVALRYGAEAAWLATPFVAAATLLSRPTTPSARLALGVTMAVGLAAAVALLWAWAAIGPDFAVLIYSLSHVELMLDAAPVVYVLPLALGVGVGLGAIVSRDPARMQGGAALLLLLVAGLAARTPIQLLAWVLASALLSRASLSLGRRLLLAPNAEQLESLAQLDAELEGAAEAGAETETETEA